MPRASKRKISKDVDDELKDNFSFLISSLSSHIDIQTFFDLFLTEEEKIMLTKRLMLHLMIEGGYDPREIAIVLGISRETVYKHKILIGAVSKGYREIINKISRRRKTREFWKIVEKFFRPVELILESQNNMKARAKFASGDWS